MTNTIFKNDLFKGKVALITGGGSGIGLRTAKELAFLKANIIIAGRDQDKLNKAADDIHSYGQEIRTLPLDIRQTEDIERVMLDIQKREGQLDILVNNAGGQFPSPAEKIPEKGWKAVIDTNLNGTFFMCQKAFQHFFKKSGGKIVNVVANFWNGFPLVSHTGAARAAVANLTKSLSTEWGQFGVSVNSVAPGVIESSGLETYAPEYQKIVRAAAKNNPTFRLGTEGEVACSIIFLLSPVSQYITGETLKVDGGESNYHPFYPPQKTDKCQPELI